MQRKRMYAEEQSNEWMPNKNSADVCKGGEEEQERKDMNNCNGAGAMPLPFSVRWTRLEDFLPITTSDENFAPFLDK